MPKHANTVRLHLLGEMGTLVVGLCVREREGEKVREAGRKRDSEVKRRWRSEIRTDRQMGRANQNGWQTDCFPKANI